MNENRKLDAEQLKEVTGGRWNQSNPFYESGDTPRYQVGQTVVSSDGSYYIAAVNEGKSGYINKEFTYRVVYADDHSRVYGEKTYESELMLLEKNGARLAGRK